MKGESRDSESGLTALGAAIVLSLAFAGEAIGQGHFVPILSVDPATQYDFNEEPGDGMVGWVFNLQQTITVNQVGWYDDGKDGLSRDFQVGLWQDLTNTADSLLVNLLFQASNPNSIIGDPVHGVTIPSGTNATLNGAYRVVDLPSPVTLVPGNYELGGLETGGTDPIRYLFGQHQSPVPGMTQGSFFYPGLGQPTFALGPAVALYAAYGLELGPMLFIDAGEPTAPRIDTRDASFGVRSNFFGFKIICSTNVPVVIEAATNLTALEWIPLESVTPTNGSIYFSDRQWTNYPTRFYRIRSP